VPRVEAADDTRVTIADDPSGIVTPFLECLLADDAPLDHLRLAAQSEIRLGGGLVAHRVAAGWRITHGDAATTLTTVEIEELYDIAYEMRRMFWLEQFPLGAWVEGFRIAERLSGGPDRGLYRAIEVATGRRALVTTSAPQRRSTDELGTALTLEVPGIARLRHVGPVAGSDHVALVEDEPPGAPEFASEPMTQLRVAALGVGVANIVAAAHARGFVLGGLRPQLIYVDGDHVIAIAPRCEPFLATAQPRGYGVAPCFDDCYVAPEVLASEPATPASDVFSLCAVLARWATGEHPFDGVGATQIVSIATGRRRAWRGDRLLGLILDGGLAAVEDRTSLADLIGRLVEL